MSKLVGIATHVHMDEPCMFLAELNLQSPGSRGFHRYQILKVVRGDKLAEHRVDLGPSAEHPEPQFRIIGGYENEDGERRIFETVGSMRDLADAQRLDAGWLDKGINYFGEMNLRRNQAPEPSPIFSI